MKTLSAAADAQRYLRDVELVFLVYMALDQYGQADVDKRYADRDGYALGGNTYVDALSPGGLQIGWVRLQARGGLASVGTSSLVIRDEEDESEAGDTYVLYNDEVVISACFVTGSETADDLVELYRGLIDRYPKQGQEWRLQLVDGTPRRLRKVPTTHINLTQHPFAPEQGRVLPVPFGVFDVGPGDGAGLSPLLVPYACTDQFAWTFDGGGANASLGQVYQWYDQAKRWAEVVTYSHAADGTLTADDPSRRMQLRPVRAKATNTKTGWYNAAKDDSSAVVSLASGDALHVWLGGTPQLGNLVGLAVVIDATGGGTYDYTVKDGVTTKASGSTTADARIALAAAEFDDWKLHPLSLEIDKANDVACTITDIYLEVSFEDYQSIQNSPPELYGKAQGWEDQASHYADGGIVESAGDAITGPVNQLQAILRGVTLHNRPVAEIDLTSFSAAASYRDAASWAFTYVLAGDGEPVSKAWLDEFGLQAGLHIWSEGAQFRVAAMDKSRPAQHFFHGTYHMPVKGGGGEQDPGQWEYDIEWTPMSVQDVVNEFALRFRRHPATGQYTESEVASGQYRLSGTCTVDAGTNKLTAVTGGTFVSDAVLAGERIYVEGYKDLEVAADATAEGELEIVAVDGAGVPDVTTAANFFVGRSLDGRMLRSQRVFKAVNALGVRQETFTDEGGFESSLIADRTTAELLREHVVEWFSQPRLECKFPLFHSAVNVQVGDVLYLYHDELPPSARPVAVTTLAAAIDADDSVIELASGTSGLLREDDDLFIWSTVEQQPEALGVVSVSQSNDQATVARGQLNTQAIAHAAGNYVYRLADKWMATGVRPLRPDDPFMRVEAVQMPSAYQPVGRVAPAGADDYAHASELDQAQYGYATNYAGRIVEDKEDSATSWVGAPS